MRDCGRKQGFGSGCESTFARFLILVFALLSCAVAQAGSAADLLEQPAPDFALKSLDGTNLRLSEYRGEIVVVNFWASWCGPCREQLDAIAELHQQFDAQGVKFLSVSIDRRSKKSDKFLNQLRPAFPVLRDEDKTVSRLYDLGDMPFAMLIDQTGTVREVYEGFDDDDQDHYQARLTALLAE